MGHKRTLCLLLQLFFIIKLSEGASLANLKENFKMLADEPAPAAEENAVENVAAEAEKKDPAVPVQLPEVNKSAESQESAEVPLTEENEVHFTEMKSQEDFDASKFAGVWYHSYRLKWSHHKYDSEVNFVKLQEDGTIKAWSRHHSDAKCSPTESTVYTQTKEHKGDWSFDTYGGLKVLYTSYNYTVLYICDHVERDGHCKKEHLEVEVLSRTNEPLEDDVVNTLTKAIESVGLTKDEFETVNNTVTCVLPGIPKNADQSCKVADYTSQENFDTEKFSGLWYEIERTAYAPNNAWESGIAKYEVKEGHALAFSYAGTRSHKCRGPFKGFAKPVSDKHGDLMMYFGQEDSYDSPWSVHFIYKILYTDYNVTVTYTCMQLNEDGTCHHSGEQLAILSRTPRLAKKTRSELYDIIAKKVCVQVYDLVQSKREEHCHKLIDAVDCSIRPMCMMYCELGFVKDSDGCNTCKCVEPESQEESSGESESGNGEASGEVISVEEDKASGDGESKDTESSSETVVVIDEEPSHESEVVEENKEEEAKPAENEAQNESENEVQEKPAVEAESEEAPVANEVEEDENEVDSEDENEAEESEEEEEAAAANGFKFKDSFYDSFKYWFKYN